MGNWPGTIFLCVFESMVLMKGYFFFQLQQQKQQKRQSFTESGSNRKVVMLLAFAARTKADLSILFVTLLMLVKRLVD